MIRPKNVKKTKITTHAAIGLGIASLGALIDTPVKTVISASANPFGEEHGSAVILDIPPQTIVGQGKYRMRYLETENSGNLPLANITDPEDANGEKSVVFSPILNREEFSLAV
jgi:hypothetical protein